MEKNMSIIIIDSFCENLSQNNLISFHSWSIFTIQYQPNWTTDAPEHATKMY